MKFTRDEAIAVSDMTLEEAMLILAWRGWDHDMCWPTAEQKFLRRVALDIVETNATIVLRKYSEKLEEEGWQPKEDRA